MKKRVDRKKVFQIVSVYVLALLAAVVCGSGHNGKSIAQNSTQQSTAKLPMSVLAK
jgi:hypothetical protein